MLCFSTNRVLYIRVNMCFDNACSVADERQTDNEIEIGIDT